MIALALQYSFDALPFVLLLVLIDGLLSPRGRRPGAQLPIANILIQIGITILASILSRALAPKPKAPEPQKADIPEVKDGKRVIRIYGANWITEPGQLAMKQVDPPDPIKQKVGKKG
jgi:hypothetical protein